MSGILPEISSAQQASPGFTEDLLEGFKARALGPYRAGSWVTSLRRAGRAGPRSPLYALCRDAERRSLEDDERRHDLRADIRRTAQALDRGRRRGPVGPERRLGRNGRALLRPELEFRRRRLEVDGRRQDLDEHGPFRLAPHRPGRHPSDGPRSRLCRGYGPPLLRERRARRLQDGRRREELEEDPLHRRQDRRCRPDPGEGGPGHAVRCDV